MEKSVSNTFLATHAIGVIIAISNYSKTSPEYQDLLEVKDNLLSIREHYQDLGIEQVIEVKDSLDAYKECCTALEKHARAAHASKGTMKILVYIYNASHGVMFGGSTMT